MSSNRSAVDRLLGWAEFAGFAAATAAIVGFEVARHLEYYRQPGSLFGFTPDPETTWVGAVVVAFRLNAARLTEFQQYVLLWMTWIGLPIVVAPVFWWLNGRSREAAPEGAGAGETSSKESGVRAGPGGWFQWLPATIASFFLLTLSIGLTAVVGGSFRGMPPAYHDEYSYIFQAKTFLAGRLYFRPHSLPEFFDQMHVLNDGGVFASRYFPGVGLWLAPWLAIGHPYWGQYLAGGLVVVMVFWIGRELGSALDGATHETTGGSGRSSEFAIGLLAALFCAISPAMLLFGNLLLSHHPTMLGLAVFLLCYVRALRSEALVWPIGGGIGLCFAMLCRPLTAFGFALPFGVHLGWLALRGGLPRSRVRLTAALAPVLAGVIVLAGYNTAITGSPLRSPYGLYTQIYTPHHGYGFHNVSRGEKLAGPKVLQNYNRWAEELTVPRAFELLGRRIAASSAWSIGWVSLAWLGGVTLVVLVRFPVQWKLLAASILGLHAVYFPFGFEGIFELSYVFESVPVLCLLAAGVCVWLGRCWRQRGRRGRLVWLVAFLVFGWSGPFIRLAIGIGEVHYSRQYYAAFDERLKAAGVRPPALVFISPDPKYQHLDLVTNSPSLNDPILRVRANTVNSKRELVTMYPDREVWWFDAQSNFFIRLPSAAEIQRLQEAP